MRHWTDTGAEPVTGRRAKSQKMAVVLDGGIDRWNYCRGELLRRGYRTVMRKSRSKFRAEEVPRHQRHLRLLVALKLSPQGELRRVRDIIVGDVSGEARC